MKKIVVMIILGIILNSCGTLGLARYGIEETIRESESEKHLKILKEKEAGGAGEKDEKIVEEAIKDVSKRAVNKRVQFGETTLLLPENTRINPKVGNIVDKKNRVWHTNYIYKKFAMYVKKNQG